MAEEARKPLSEEEKKRLEEIELQRRVAEALRDLGHGCED